ncbi:MAG: OmpH family outer membrane protein [Paracoccaceae bacterium]
MSRFRRHSRAALCAVLLALAPAAGGAQQQASPILTIDQDRLFSETQLGAEALAALERDAQALATENAEIEEALIAEELALTEQRAGMGAEEFRALADAFDSRVQQLRAEQDEKARQLNRQRDDARAAFFNDVAAVLSDIVREKGALVVIDRRDVFLSADRIDITGEAIERINEMAAGDDN